MKFFYRLRSEFLSSEEPEDETKFFLLCRNAVRHNLPVFDDDHFQKKQQFPPYFICGGRYVRILILEKMLDFNCACSIQIIASKHTNHNL